MQIKNALFSPSGKGGETITPGVDDNYFGCNFYGVKVRITSTCSVRAFVGCRFDECDFIFTSDGPGINAFNEVLTRQCGTIIEAAEVCMTDTSKRDEAIDSAARQAGGRLESWMTNPTTPAMWHFTPRQLAAFWDIAVKVEREACAKLCEDMVDASECAQAIRARSNT